MSAKPVLSAPRQVLLEELHERLDARLTAVEKRLRLLIDEFEKLELERIRLQVELRVLQEETAKCRDEGSD